MCGTMGAYDDVVAMPLSGKVRTIDRCIHHIVAALNAGGVETVACCCGHGKMPGRIDLADGRVLVVMSPAEATGYVDSKKQVSITDLASRRLEQIASAPAVIEWVDEVPEPKEVESE